MRFHVQELFIDFHSDDQARDIVYYHGWSDVWIKCTERFPDVSVKVELILLLMFPTKYVAEQVPTKYCTWVVNIAIVLT